MFDKDVKGRLHGSSTVSPKIRWQQWKTLATTQTALQKCHKDIVDVLKKKKLMLDKDI